MKRILFAICCVLITNSAFSQYFFYDDRYMDNDILFEAGVSLGIMNAVTDVGQKKGSGFSPGYYDWGSSQFNYSIHGAIMYKSIVEGRLELVRGAIAGKDSKSNSRFVQLRNLSYKSKIFELNLVGIFHPIMLFDLTYLPKLSPYVIAGVGIFSYFPMTQYDGEWIPLRRMNTEGQTYPQYPQRKQYSLRTVSYPFGGGLKYEINAKWNVRFEGLYRLTGSDYLDDASTTYPDINIYDNPLQRILSHRYKEIENRNRTGQKRGSSAGNDRFFNITFKAGYVIGREKRPMYRGR